MNRVPYFVGIISILLFTIGCPQSKESLSAYEEMRSIAKVTVSDDLKPAFANSVYVWIIDYLALTNISVHHNESKKTGKISALDCTITHHSVDTAEIECAFSREDGAFVYVRSFRGVGMNEIGQGMFKTPPQILARRAIDELHKNLEFKIAQDQKTKNDFR